MSVHSVAPWHLAAGLPGALRALALCALVGAGCISLEQPAVPLDAPIRLRPQARELLGAPLDSVLTQTPNTVADVPFTTQLVRGVSDSVKNAVVSIYVRTQTPVRISLLPIRLPLTSVRVRVPGRGLGSGFFVHPAGYILTNDHVIRDATQIRALTRDEADLEVIVLARDPVYDLALLKVKDAERSFPALPMGDAEAVGVGDLTIAVGNPLGLGHTVTFGIISQTHRNLSGVSPAEGRPVQFLQTDSAINPGSSGGPLITLSGAWVGVNTAGIPSAQNIGFAVPSGQVLEFVGEILAGKGDPEAQRR